jgi:hypothetical protein
MAPALTAARRMLWRNSAAASMALLGMHAK